MILYVSLCVNGYSKDQLNNFSMVSIITPPFFTNKRNYFVADRNAGGYYVIVTSEMNKTYDRIIEMKLKHRYSITKLIETLKKSQCCYAQQNYYLFNYYDDVLSNIGHALGIDYSKRIRTLEEIKN